MQITLAWWWAPILIVAVGVGYAVHDYVTDHQGPVGRGLFGFFIAAFCVFLAAGIVIGRLLA